MRPIPAGHPLRQVFDRLTARGLAQVGLSERDLVAYLSDMLVRFVHIDELYRFRDDDGRRVEYLVDMIGQAEQYAPPARAEAYRHIGDYALFLLGFYPESLQGSRKVVGPDYYAEQGRRSYSRAAEMTRRVTLTALLRRLSEQFETCMMGVHWVRQYSHDPFYQYMLRQFGLV